MWINGISSGVTLLICLLFSTGAYLLFAERIYVFIEKIRMLRRLQARKKEGMQEGKLNRKIRRLLIMATGIDQSPMLLYGLLLSLFFSSFFIGFRNLSPLIALFMSMTVTSLPLLLLWLRISSLRRKGSHEGERLTGEILREYRINNINIYEALEKVVSSNADIKITGRLLSRLLYELRYTANPEKIKAATDSFAYAVGTNWSKMLAHNIYIAAKDGCDVSGGMEDILIQLREAKSIMEERKQLNSEAVRMTYFMVPSTYLVTIFMAVKFLDIPLSKVFNNQFATYQGFMLFYLMVFLFIGNMGLIQFVLNQKFDY